MHLRLVGYSDEHRLEEIISQHTSSGYTEKTTDAIIMGIENPYIISFVAVDDDDVAQGVGSITIYPEDTDSAEYDITHPEYVDTYPEGQIAVLRFGYVDKNYMQQGIGTNLCTRCIEEAVLERDIDAVMCEAWVKPETKSSDSLLERLNFTLKHKSDDYYDQTEYADPTESCSGCMNQLKNCNCSGAIYIHSNPGEIVNQT